MALGTRLAPHTDGSGRSNRGARGLLYGTGCQGSIRSKVPPSLAKARWRQVKTMTC